MARVKEEEEDEDGENGYRILVEYRLDPKEWPTEASIEDFINEVTNDIHDEFKGINTARVKKRW